MIERLKLLPRYLLNLGLFNGAFVFIQVELLSLYRIKLSGYSQSIFLRKDTSDRNVFREIFLFRLYAFPIKDIPKVIIDGGANIGLSSVYFANRFKESLVYAIEPEGSNLEALQKNVAGYPNVKIVSAALWPTDTRLKIKNTNESKWAISVEETTSREADTLEGISISTLLEKFSIDQIDLLKLDIEGSERELFSRGADTWLPKTKSIVIELHDWMKPGCSTSFFSAIAKYPVAVTLHEGMLVVNNTDMN